MATHQAQIGMIVNCDTVQIWDTTDYNASGQTSLLKIKHGYFKHVLTRPDGKQEVSVLLSNITILTVGIPYIKTFDTPISGIYQVDFLSIPYNRSTTEVYAVDDCFFFGGKFYKCLIAGTFYPNLFSPADGKFKEITEDEISDKFRYSANFNNVCHIEDDNLKPLLKKVICKFKEDKCDYQTLCKDEDFKKLLGVGAAWFHLKYNFEEVTESNKDNLIAISNMLSTNCGCGC